MLAIRSRLAFGGLGRPWWWTVGIAENGVSGNSEFIWRPRHIRAVEGVTKKVNSLIEDQALANSPCSRSRIDLRQWVAARKFFRSDSKSLPLDMTETR